MFSLNLSNTCKFNLTWFKKTAYALLSLPPTITSFLLTYAFSRNIEIQDIKNDFHDEAHDYIFPIIKATIGGGITFFFMYRFASIILSLYKDMFKKVKNRVKWDIFTFTLSTIMSIGSGIVSFYVGYLLFEDINIVLAIIYGILNGTSTGISRAVGTEGTLNSLYSNYFTKLNKSQSKAAGLILRIEHPNLDQLEKGNYQEFVADYYEQADTILTNYSSNPSLIAASLEKNKIKFTYNNTFLSIPRKNDSKTRINLFRLGNLSFFLAIINYLAFATLTLPDHDEVGYMFLRALIALPNLFLYGYILLLAPSVIYQFYRYEVKNIVQNKTPSNLISLGIAISTLICVAVSIDDSIDHFPDYTTYIVLAPAISLTGYHIANYFRHNKLNTRKLERAKKINLIIGLCFTLLMLGLTSVGTVSEFLSAALEDKHSFFTKIIPGKATETSSFSKTLIGLDDIISLLINLIPICQLIKQPSDKEIIKRKDALKIAQTQDPAARIQFTEEIKNNEQSIENSVHALISQINQNKSTSDPSHQSLQPLPSQNSPLLNKPIS